MIKSMYHYILLLTFPTLIYAAKPITVPAVRIQAPRTTNNPTISSGLKTTITRQQMRMAGIHSVTQALQSLGNIQLQDISGNGSQVLLSMRGFGANASSNTLLLVNGIPITNPDMAAPDLNALPISEMEAVEIINGSESVLYGDQAVGGVINIITRTDTDEQARLACLAGSYRLRDCQASIAKNTSALKLHFTLNQKQTDNYRQHNHYQQEQLIGQANYRYSGGKVDVNYHLTNENMQYPGALTAAEVRSNRRQSNNSTDYFRDGNQYLRIANSVAWNEFWRNETTVAWRRTRGYGVLFSPFQQDRDTFLLQPKFIQSTSAYHLIAGAEGQFDHYRLTSLLGLTAANQQQFSLYSIINFNLPANLQLSLGGRLAQQNLNLSGSTSDKKINRAQATTLGISDALPNNTNVYLRRAESFRFPKADENAFSTPDNQGLRPQRGAAYELGAEFNQPFLTGKINLYQLNLTDEITFDPTQTPLAPFGTNRNLAPTFRRGFSLVGKKNLVSNVTLDGEFNYVNARFQQGINKGHRIPLVAEELLHAGLLVNLKEDWFIYPEIVYTGNQYAANDDGNVAGKIGGYALYNVSLRYLKQHFSASFRIDNIFAKDYSFYTVYQSGMNSEFFYPAPDRHFTLTLDYSFA